VIRLYEEAKSLRQPHEADWRTAAAHCLPMHYASWQTDGPANYNGMSTTRRISYDTTGARSLEKYVSILERLATPAGQRWHTLTASDPALRSKRRVKAYFDELTTVLFKYRNNPAAGFRIATSETYGALGVYGNGPVFIGARKPSMLHRAAGIKYVACSMRDVFFLTDDEGNVNVVFRRLFLNIRQFKTRFPGEDMPTMMKMEASKPTPNERRYFEFVHYVSVRDEDTYDPSALDSRRHPICGLYLCIESKEYVADEHGYQSMPYKIPRVTTVSGDAYGYSPAVRALASLGGASTMKKTNLKQGNKAVDPVLLAHDDNVMNGEVDMRPGAVNYGGVNREGRALIQALPSGNFQIGEILLQDERKDTEDSFFVTLFEILENRPEMTATEVMEHIANKAALLSPTMGRLQTELLGPTIDREIDVLAELGKLPEMPPELIEAEGEFETVYTSPMAKSLNAEGVSGFMRSVEMSLGIANATGDASSLDHYDFDVATPEIADIMAVPVRWMKDEKSIEKAREARAAQQQQQEMMKNAGGLASAAKTVTEMGAPE
jgi:hypothetical protein